MLNFKRGYLEMWIIMGALVSAGTLLVISMIGGEKFPWGLYAGFMVGWIVGAIALSKIRR